MLRLVYRSLYRALALLAVPLACAVFLWRGLRERGYWSGLGERFGFGPVSARRSIWVHAVSVGEVQAAASLVRELQLRHPELAITLTTTTPAGAARARTLFADAATVRFLPFDTRGSVRRFLARARPVLAIIVEKELWPTLYRECGLRGIPLVLASAALSERARNRYRRLMGLFADALGVNFIVAAQTAADAARFIDIGVPPRQVEVIGNLKYDLVLPSEVQGSRSLLRTRYAIGDRLVLVGGSTYESEETALLATQATLRAEGIDLLLVLAPRHPPRFGSVALRLEAAGVEQLRRSLASSSSVRFDVLLLDTVGELLQFYAAADLVFVGGSLEAGVGGHNLIEPAALGVASLSGPHCFNSAEVAAALTAAGALEIIEDEAGLTDAVRRLAQDAAERRRRGELAQRLVAANGGSLERLLARIEPLIADAPSRSANR